MHSRAVSTPHFTITYLLHRRVLRYYPYFNMRCSASDNIPSGGHMYWYITWLVQLCCDMSLAAFEIIQFVTDRSVVRTTLSGSYQGRIIHCAGCTMEGAPVARGPPPISCQIFTTLFFAVFWLRVREKGPRLTLVWAPEWLIRPWFVYRACEESYTRTA